MFLLGFFVVVLGQLAAHQFQLFHQLSRTIAAQRNASGCNYLSNRPCARRTITFRMHSSHLTQQVNMLSINGIGALDPILVTAAMNSKGIAQYFDGIALVELFD